jgi:hypothetical protein
VLSYSAQNNVSGKACLVHATTKYCLELDVRGVVGMARPVRNVVTDFQSSLLSQRSLL